MKNENWKLLFDENPIKGQSCWVTDGESVLWAEWVDYRFYSYDRFLDGDFILWQLAQEPSAPGKSTVREILKLRHDAKMAQRSSNANDAAAQSV